MPPTSKTTLPAPDGVAGLGVGPSVGRARAKNLGRAMAGWACRKNASAKGYLTWLLRTHVRTHVRCHVGRPCFA